MWELIDGGRQGIECQYSQSIHSSMDEEVIRISQFLCWIPELRHVGLAVLLHLKGLPESSSLRPLQFLTWPTKLMAIKTGLFWELEGACSVFFF